MATTSTVPWYGNHERHRRRSDTNMPMPPGVKTSSSTTTTYVPRSFPDNFQDFFDALNEDADDLPNMLEDKLIPRFDFKLAFINIAFGLYHSRLFD